MGDFWCAGVYGAQEFRLPSETPIAPRCSPKGSPALVAAHPMEGEQRVPLHEPPPKMCRSFGPRPKLQ